MYWIASYLYVIALAIVLLIKILSPIRISVRLLATRWNNQIFKLIERVIKFWWYLRATYYCINITIIKSLLPNLANAFADSYPCKAAATPECPLSNRCYALGNSHTCKAAARIECLLSNRCYAIANSHTC